MFLEMTDSQFAMGILFMSFVGFPALVVIWDRILDAINAKDKNATDAIMSVLQANK